MPPNNPIRGNRALPPQRYRTPAWSRHISNIAIVLALSASWLGAPPTTRAASITSDKLGYPISDNSADNSALSVNANGDKSTGNVPTHNPENFSRSLSKWRYDDSAQSPSSSDVWLPILSFLIPGSGQLVRQQYLDAMIYATSALTSLRYTLLVKKDLARSDSRHSLTEEKSTTFRKYMLGLQTYQTIGGISLYHTFRSSVWQRQKHHEYNFLDEGDSVQDILLAPFQFQYLRRPSTWIPLSIVSGFAWYQAHHPPKSMSRAKLSNDDYLFSAAYSYNAGTHEEAMFRGWLMPLLHEAGCSFPVSNLTQATLFALAHINQTSIPFPQFFLGLHLGQTTRNNNWRVSESIFIHTWWDVIAFIAANSVERKQAKFQLNLPPLTFIF